MLNEIAEANLPTDIVEHKARVRKLAEAISAFGLEFDTDLYFVGINDLVKEDEDERYYNSNCW